MEGSASRAEPSTLKPEIVEGSISQARTLHALGLNHGQFDVNRTNLPRGDSISRTVHVSEPPSMLMLHFADGSILQARTLHENAPHHGRFIIQSGTIHAEARNRGRFHSPGPNPPRFRPESRTVRCKQSNLPRGDSISRTVHVSDAHLPC